MLSTDHQRPPASAVLIVRRRAGTHEASTDRRRPLRPEICNTGIGSRPAIQRPRPPAILSRPVSRFAPSHARSHVRRTFPLLLAHALCGGATTSPTPSGAGDAPRSTTFDFTVHLTPDRVPARSSPFPRLPLVHPPLPARCPPAFLSPPSSASPRALAPTPCFDLPCPVPRATLAGAALPFTAIVGAGDLPRPVTLSLVPSPYAPSTRPPPSPMPSSSFSLSPAIRHPRSNDHRWQQCLTDHSQRSRSVARVV